MAQMMLDIAGYETSASQGMHGSGWVTMKAAPPTLRIARPHAHRDRPEIGISRRWRDMVIGWLDLKVQRKVKFSGKFWYRGYGRYKYGRIEI